MVLNLILHLDLRGVQLIHDRPQRVVEGIEFFESLIHTIGFVLHAADFVLARPNIPLQLLDLVIQHELELLEFLGALLEFIDLALLLADGLVTFVDLLLLLVDGLLEFLVLLLELLALLLELLLLVFEFLGLHLLRRDLLLVHGDLRLGLQAGVGHLQDLLLVLLFEGLDFVLRLGFDLLDGGLVLDGDGLDVLLHALALGGLILQE